MMDPTAEGLEQPGDRETATVSPLDQLPEHTGRRLGYSAWQRITQERINRFAAPTGDWQWIHVAPQRAARGPFGATVAHGFPTLAAPLPAGASTRQGVKLVDAEQRSGGVQITVGATLEVHGQAKPVCVAEVVFRYHP